MNRRRNFGTCAHPNTIMVATSLCFGSVASFRRQQSQHRCREQTLVPRRQCLRVQAAKTADGPSLAIVGVTGAVGQEFLRVREALNCYRGSSFRVGPFRCSGKTCHVRQWLLKHCSRHFGQGFHPAPLLRTKAYLYRVADRGACNDPNGLVIGFLAFGEAKGSLPACMRERPELWLLSS